MSPSTEVQSWSSFDISNNNIASPKCRRASFAGFAMPHSEVDEDKQKRVHDEIKNAFTKRIEGVDVDTCAPGGEDPFFVVDLGEVYRQHLRWKKNLGRVEPFYGKLCLIARYVVLLENSLFGMIYTDFLSLLQPSSVTQTLLSFD